MNYTTLILNVSFFHVHYYLSFPGVNIHITIITNQTNNMHCQKNAVVINQPPVHIIAMIVAICDNLLIIFIISNRFYQLYLLKMMKNAPNL